MQNIEKKDNIFNIFENIKPIYYIVFFFFLSTIIHFVVGGFCKELSIYPDEIRFYDMAKNISKGNWFVVRGMKMDYQKILYSIFLSPFFLLKDVSMRVNMISLFNSIIMSSSIFPMYILYKNMYEKEERKISDMFIFLLFSFSAMQLYSMTFMSESLYVPIYLWCMVCIIKFVKYDNIKFAILAGILVYINYVCREIMLVYYVASIITIGLYYYMYKKNKKNHITFVVYALVPIILYMIFKFTVFKNMMYTYGGNYNQTTLSVLNSINVWTKLIHSSIYFVVALFVLFLFFPIVYLIDNFKYMSNEEKIVLLSNFINIILMAGVVSYTISIREDIKSDVVRLHFRYILVSLVIILFVFLKNLNADRIKKIFDKKINIILFVAIILLSIIFFNGMNSYPIDCPQFATYSLIVKTITLFFETEKEMSEMVLQIIKLIVLMVPIIIFILLYINKKYKILNNIIILLIISIMVVNNLSAMIQSFRYDAPPNLVKDVTEISKYFNKKKNNNILYITDEGRMRDARCVMDTYFDSDKNLLITQDKYLFCDNNPTQGDMKNIKLECFINGYVYNDINKIDYIIIDKIQTIENMDFKHVSEIKDVKLRNYRIFKNDKPKELEIYDYAR